MPLVPSIIQDGDGAWVMTDAEGKVTAKVVKAPTPKQPKKTGGAVAKSSVPAADRRDQRVSDGGDAKRSTLSAEQAKGKDSK